jgi:N-acetylglucosamine malate deacetylase 1
MNTNRTVHLVVVAHPDDEILGFGASGAKFAARGDLVQTIFMCGGVDARTQRPSDRELTDDIEAALATVGFASAIFGSFPNIRMNSVPHIELVQFVEAQIEHFQPDHIFTHHPGDINDDHRHTAHACLAAARLPQRKTGLKAIKSINFMEIASATDWSYPVEAPAFQPNMFVEIGDFIDKKLAALACYRDVMRPYPHPRSDEAIRACAVSRGASAGLDRAEAFETIFSLPFD